MDFPLYQHFHRLIDERHPDLINELSSKELGPKERPHSLGIFIEVPEQYLDEWDPYYIFILTDHPHARDEDKAVAVLLHEYGHFVFRTIIYPRLFGLGKCIRGKLSSRPAGSTPMDWDYLTRLINVGEELGAWIISWTMLFQHGLLNKRHLQYGWKCWKGYWWRLKWNRKND